MNLTLARATEADLPFIMATERLEGYAALVGNWEEQRHREALADGSHAYFIGLDGPHPVGFATLRHWNSADGVTLVRRVAVATPGRGQGRKLLAGVADRVFEETAAYRLHIGLFPENLRARRAYEAAGFTPEGIARAAVFFGGVHRDELVMSLLRPEWQARRKPSAG
ncbi:MAG TPA: GNAT family protein [Mesorhizobium sp.]